MMDFLHCHPAILSYRILEIIQPLISNWVKYQFSTIAFVVQLPAMYFNITTNDTNNQVTGFRYPPYFSY